MRTPLKPRVSNYFGVSDPGDYWPDGTWLECESFAYSANGAQLRRSYAKCDDGKKRVVHCGIADTYFTLPAHATINRKYVAGYITTDEEGVKFHSSNKGQ